MRQNDHEVNLFALKDISEYHNIFNIVTDNFRRTLQFTSADFMGLLLTWLLGPAELQLEREMKDFGLLS